MTIATAIILAICGLTYWAESRADYVLLLERTNGERQAVGRYQSKDDEAEKTLCDEEWWAYKRGAWQHREVLDSKGGMCVPCDEFPDVCQEGI